MAMTASATSFRLLASTTSSCSSSCGGGASRGISRVASRNCSKNKKNDSPNDRGRAISTVTTVPKSVAIPQTSGILASEQLVDWAASLNGTATGATPTSSNEALLKFLRSSPVSTELLLRSSNTLAASPTVNPNPVANALLRRSSSSSSSTETAPTSEIFMAAVLALATSASFLAGGHIVNTPSSSLDPSWKLGETHDNHQGFRGGNGPNGPNNEDNRDGDAVFLAAAAFSALDWGESWGEEEHEQENPKDRTNNTTGEEHENDTRNGTVWDTFFDAAAGVRIPSWGDRNGAQPVSVTSNGQPATVSVTDTSHAVDTTHRAKGPERYDVSVKALRGGRLSMEDEWVVAEGGRFAAVFDGHGGGGVSSFLRDTFYECFLRHVQSLEQSSAKIVRDTTIGGELSTRIDALRAAFTDMEKAVLADASFDYQGSTAVAVAVHEDEDGRRTILSGNVGDSRAILSRSGRAVDLTRDHKPNDEIERRRIMAMGESIEWDHYSQVHRVRNLSLSRAIGDKFAKPAVSPEADIKAFPRLSSQSQLKNKATAIVLEENDEDDEFIVLASDGLWDVMGSDDVVNFVHRRLCAPPSVTSKSTPTGPTSLTSTRPCWSTTGPDETDRILKGRRKNMSKYVAQEAIRRGSGDNVCVVIVWLQDADKAAERAKRRDSRATIGPHSLMRLSASQPPPQ